MIFFRLLFFFAAIHLQLFSLNVEIHYPSSKIALDQQVDITLLLTYPEGYHTDINVLIEHLFRNAALKSFPFVLNAPPAISKKTEKGTIQETIVFQLQPELPGKHTLTFYNIPLFENGSKKLADTYISDLFTLEVIVPSSSIETLRPSPPLSLSPRLPISLSQENAQIIEEAYYSSTALKESEEILKARTFPWNKIGAAFLGIFFGLILWMISLDKKSIPKADASKIKESEKAFKALKNAHLLENGQFPQFIDRLDFILKKHLQEKTGLKATLLTTDEILPHVSEEMQKFFIQADQIKFARHMPSLEECQRAEKTVETFLNQ